MSTVMMTVQPPVHRPTLRSWLLVAAVTMLVGVVFMTDEHRWDRSGLENYIESTEERARATADGNNVRRLAFLLLGTAGTLLLLSSGKFPAIREPLGLALLLATAWTFSSVLWAETAGFTTKRLLLLLLCSAGVVGVASCITLRQLAIVAVCVTGSYLLLGIVAEVVQGNFRPWASDYRFAGTKHPNAQSTNCGTMALAAYALCDRASSVRQRLLSTNNLGRLLCGVAIVFLVLTKSRTAIATVLMTLNILWATRRNFGSNLIAAGVGMLMTLVLAFVLFATGAGQSLDQAANYGRADSQGALNGRLPIWEICLRRAGTQLPIGFGYDGFWTPHRIKSVSQELGWSISSAHSEYVDIALGLGIVGLALYVVVLAAGISWFWLRYLRLGHGGDAMVLGLLIFGAVQGLMETGSMHPSTMSPFIAVAGMIRLAFFTDHQTQRWGVM